MNRCLLCLSKPKAHVNQIYRKSRYEQSMKVFYHLFKQEANAATPEQQWCLKYIAPYGPSVE